MLREGEPPDTSQMRLVAPAARRELERRFELRAVLGRGAMGTVLLARDRQLSRDVALKLPLRGGGQRRLARFMREGEITASLSHPGIVAVHSAGVIEDQPWIAYELVSGARTLDQVLEHLPLRRRVELVRDAAAALGHAHAQGVVHRDVKPQNLLVDGEGRLKVADFGLAAAEGQEERLTQTGAVVGTPHYMSPEQVSAKGQVGPGADVWGLGVILYQALSGQLPFQGETFMGLAHAIADATPTAPTRLRRETPRELEAVCLRALARLPQDRYPDASRLAADLDAWLGGTPVSATRSGLAPGSRGRWRRGALLALPLALAGGLLAFSLHAARVAPPPDAAPPPGTGEERPSPGESAERARAAQAGQRWRELQALELAERLAAARAWLTEFGDLPLAAEARALVAGRPAPVRRTTLRHASRGPARGSFVREDALLTWGKDGSVAWWSLPEGRLEQRWQLSRAPLLSLTSLGGSFWAGDKNGELHAALTVDPRRESLTQGRSAEGGAILELAASPAGVVAYGGDGWVKLVFPERALNFDIIDPVRGLAFVEGGRLVAASGDRLDLVRVAENVFRLFQVEDGRVLREERLGFMPTAVAAAPDGARFALATSSGHVLLYDAAGERQRVLAGLKAGTLAQEGVVISDLPLACRDTVSGLAWSRDGRHVLAVAASSEVTPPFYELRVWDAATGEEVWRDLALPRRPQGLELDPSGRWLAVGSQDGVVEVWEL